MANASPIEPGPGDSVWIRVKVVPGAKRDEIAGPLGDRLKIRVAAPPEGGRANKAVCGVIAAALGLKARDVTVVTGQTNPEKTIIAQGVDADAAGRRLGL